MGQIRKSADWIESRDRAERAQADQYGHFNPPLNAGAAAAIDGFSMNLLQTAFLTRINKGLVGGIRIAFEACLRRLAGHERRSRHAALMLRFVCLVFMLAVTGTTRAAMTASLAAANSSVPLSRMWTAAPGMDRVELPLALAIGDCAVRSGAVSAPQPLAYRLFTTMDRTAPASI